MAGVEVEVVGRFVEQQDVGPLQQLGGQAQRYDLTAAQRAEGAVEGEAYQAEAVELGAGAFLDVPVVADDREVFLADVAGLHGVQRADHRGDAQDFGDREVTGQGEGLGEMAEGAADGHGPAGGAQFMRRSA